MKTNSSRRDFLYTGLALPAAGLASTVGFGKPTCPSLQASSPVSTPKLTYSTLGKTGLKVMRVGLGAGASDAIVIQRAADMGINYFDTARAYANGNHERMVGIGLRNKRKDVILGSRSEAPTKERALRDLDLSLREIRTDYLDLWGPHSKDRYRTSRMNCLRLCRSPNSKAKSGSPASARITRRT